MGWIGMFGSVGKIQKFMVQAGQLGFIQGLKLSHQLPFDIVPVVQGDQYQQPGQGDIRNQFALPADGLPELVYSFAIDASKFFPGH